VIKSETHTVLGLYTQYVMLLAAIPAVGNFIGQSVVGYSGLGPTYRVPMAAGVANLVIAYVLSLGSVYVMAMVIDVLAPKFAGEKDFMQAFKVAAFFPRLRGSRASSRSCPRWRSSGSWAPSTASGCCTPGFRS
jgi:hypothetical protein